ncbi:MAG: DUF308 domain-containing protein [Methanospirillaceae archaeon]|nr:DUF308 domain-containing protein [Methanospirillaceae archaeon]
MFFIPALDEMLSLLDEGIWEVIIPKDQVTEPLDAEWKVSPINVPTPGCVASYRKGRFHLHETVHEWRVHRDRFDPVIHPFLHLIDDAPLLLMIKETMVTFALRKNNTNSFFLTRFLEEQADAVKKHLAIGIVLFCIGLFFLIEPYLAFQSIFYLFLPVVLVCLGFYFLHAGISFSFFRIKHECNVFSGIIALIAGVAILYLPLIVWILVFLGIVSAWMFASAAMLLLRVMKGREAVPEGFISRLVIGFLSLILGIAGIILPEAVIDIFMMMFGFIALLIGISLIGIGYQLHARTHE